MPLTPFISCKLHHWRSWPCSMQHALPLFGALVLATGCGSGGGGGDQAPLPLALMTQPQGAPEVTEDRPPETFAEIDSETAIYLNMVEAAEVSIDFSESPVPLTTETHLRIYIHSEGSGKQLVGIIRINPEKNGITLPVTIPRNGKPTISYEFYGPENKPISTAQPTGVATLKRFNILLNGDKS